MTKYASLFIVILCLAAVSPAWAGGPLYVSPTGVAAHWEEMPISLHPETGACADFSNEDMMNLIDENMDYWTSIEGIELSFEVVSGEITEDITVENYNDIAASESESLHPFIFDDDGTITEDLFGQSSEFYLLGFAGFTVPDGDDSVITSGLALFNCYCVNNAVDCPAAVEESELNATMVHEMGHFIGLDHTAVNEDLVDAPCDTGLAGDCDTVPIMYPTTFDSAEPLQVQQDDRIAALALYGSDDWESSYCLVTGSLLDIDGNPLRCADVQAQTDDDADTVSFVSGYLALAEDDNSDDDTVDEGECDSGCGDFILRLDPSKSYALVTEPLSETWISSSSVGPCVNGQLSGIIREEIGSVSGCSAGETLDLGEIQTQSTGGQAESGEDSGDSDSSSDTCGDGQDFSTCDPLLSCSLNRSVQDAQAREGLQAFCLLAFSIYLVMRFKYGVY